MVKYERIDVYWNKVGKMTRSTGKRKYPALMKLARIALTLKHGNANVEKGFSKNKLLLISHRTRLEIPAINGLRMVSFYSSKYRREPHKLSFSKDVAYSIRSFHASYEERKRRRERGHEKRRQEENRGEGEAEEREVDDLLKKAESSEALLKEAMSMLDEAMKMKDKGRAMTKAEAANAIIQNTRNALDDVQTAISNRDSKRTKKRKT